MKMFVGCLFLLATCAWFGPGQQCADLDSLQRIRGGQEGVIGVPIGLAVPACDSDVANPDTGSCEGDSNCTTITLTNYKENKTNGDAILHDSNACSEWKDKNGNDCGGSFVDETIRLKSSTDPETGDPYCQ